MSSLGKDWSGSQMAPKSKEALGPRLGDKEVDSEVVCKLDTHASVFQAEVRAISECAQTMLEGDCRGKLVLVCSDCQGALRALDGYLVRSREVLYCRELLGELSRANSVKLLRVPGRSGVVVNEKADRLAIRGIRGVRATRCSMGLLECYLKELLEKWLEKIA